MFGGHIYTFGEFYTDFSPIRSAVCIAGWGIVGLIAAIILPRSIFGYRRVLRERVFIEWLVSFGLFVTAFLQGLLLTAFMIGWIPRSPVSFLEALILLLAVTLGAAVLNARLPILRWFVNLIVIGFLFVSVIVIENPNGIIMGWQYLPFQDFFDSAQSYPVLFGLMILSAVIVFATVTTMILGVFYLRSKTTGHFFSRRTIKWIFCTKIAAVLAVSAFLYAPARVPCLADILVCRYRDDWTTHHNAKMTALASEIIRSTDETDRLFGWSHGIRAEMNLRERKYDEAIADFDIAIRLCPSEAFTMFYYTSRGEAKMGKGDFSGALEDFDKAVSLNRHNEELCAASQTKQPADFAQTEVDSKKKIQQINKFRFEGNSKIPSFTTLY